MKKTNKNQNTGIALGMCLGVALGTALGSAFDNIALGTSLGISIGLAVGYAIGAGKDKAVNQQLEEKAYTIKKIETLEINEYDIILEDKTGEETVVRVPAGVLTSEMFFVGDVVYMDEDGMIEQAYDDE